MTTLDELVNALAEELPHANPEAEVSVTYRKDWSHEERTLGSQNSGFEWARLDTITHSGPDEKFYIEVKRIGILGDVEWAIAKVILEVAAKLGVPAE